jgi:hypothetical protein
MTWLGGTRREPPRGGGKDRSATREDTEAKNSDSHSGAFAKNDHERRDDRGTRSDVKQDRNADPVDEIADAPWWSSAHEEIRKPAHDGSDAGNTSATRNASQNARLPLRRSASSPPSRSASRGRSSRCVPRALPAAANFSDFGTWPSCRNPMGPTVSRPSLEKRRRLGWARRMTPPAIVDAGIVYDFPREPRPHRLLLARRGDVHRSQHVRLGIRPPERTRASAARRKQSTSSGFPECVAHDSDCVARWTDTGAQLIAEAALSFRS